MLLSQEYRPQWTRPAKITFRLIVCYLSLYIFFIFFGTLFETPFKWVAKTILGVSYHFEVGGNGSGDHTYAYICLFMNVVITLLVTTIWTLLDQKIKGYNQFLYWFLIVLRLALICAMFLYGFVKIFQIQFPRPSLTRLLEPLGNFSPMGLAWTYMGYSKGFGMFAGFMEIVGGLLLIPRRTQTLGAFIVIGVMTHVAMMNLMFDIPVKLLSIHLILMAVVIFSTDMKRFTNVFIKNRPTETYTYFYPIKDKSYTKTIFWVKTIGLILCFSTATILGFLTEKEMGSNKNKPFLYGIWETTNFVKNKDTIAPLLTSNERWRYLIIESKNAATVKLMDDKKEYLKFKVDTTAKKISMYIYEKDTLENNFEYSNPNDALLKLEGVLYNDTIQVMLKRKNLDEFLLNARGFHWINESPLNK